jgi:hypothetical protein
LGPAYFWMFSFSWNLLISWCRASPENTIVNQLANKVLLCETLKTYYRLHRRQAWLYPEPVHTITSYISTSVLIILSHSLLVPSIFSSQNDVCISYFTHAVYMSCPSHPP